MVLCSLLYPEIISQTQNHLVVQYTIQQKTTQNVKRLVNFKLHFCIAK